MNVTIAMIIHDSTLRQRLETLVADRHPAFQFIGGAGDVQAAAILLEEHKPGIILLETHLGRASAFDLLKTRGPHRPQVVMFTDDKAHAFDAIPHGPAAMLLRSFSDDQLDKALMMALDRLRHARLSPLAGAHRIALPVTRGCVMPRVDDILFCKSNDNLTEVYPRHQPREVVTRTLKRMEELLARHGFLRVHQSYLVNGRHVTRFVRGKNGDAAGEYLVLDDGAQIPVGRQYKAAFLGHWELP